MDFNALIKRAIAIITKPKEEWEIIKNENLSISDIFVKYALVLAAVPAVAGLIGFSLIGYSTGFGTFRVPFGHGLVWAILQYVFTLGGAFLFAFIIDSLAPTFGCSKDLPMALKIVIFSYFPAWIAGVLFLIPSLSILVSIASIYSLVLLYFGMKQLKEPPQDKITPYFIVSLLVAVVVFFVVSYMTRTIAWGSMGARIFRGF